MPLELLEYQVFRQSAPLFTQNEIDAPQVPIGQVWRCEHLAVAMYFPAGSSYSSPGPPQVGVYDLPSPGETVVPCQLTTLSPLIQKGLIAGTSVGGTTVQTAWYDVDDDATITLQPGNQLAVVFYSYFLGTAGSPATCAVRAEFSVYQGTAGQPQPAAGLTPGPTIPVGI